MESIDGETFDVTVVGTGLTECIVAAALSRAGMRVLHVDHNGFYGSSDATLSFREFHDLANSALHSATHQEQGRTSVPKGVAEILGENLEQLHCATPQSLGGYTVIETSCYPGKQQQIDETALASGEKGGSTSSSTPDNNHGASEAQKMSPETTTPSSSTEATTPAPCTEDSTNPPPAPEITAPALSPEAAARLERTIQAGKTLEQLQKDSRYLCIDLSPRLLLCRGDLVNVLVESGVSHYVEFRPLDAAFVATSLTKDGDRLQTVRVPCSKGEIFKSRDISMLEKRQLMKFLQYCMDKNTETEGGADGAYKWLNESTLNQGRSLPRPQNKTIGQFSVKDENMPFNDFLKTTCKLPPRLCSFVTYGVAMLSRETDTTTIERGMACVQRYLKALGRFGGTAFLSPLYGTCELAQSFSRLCAVYGGIYLLRQDDINVVVNNANKVVGLTLQNNESVKCRRVILQQDYCPVGLLPGARMFEVRMVCICSGVVLQGGSTASGDDNRVLLVIPPQTAELDNQFAIHVLQLDHGTMVTTKSTVLLHVTTLMSADEVNSSGKRAKKLNKVLSHLGPHVLWKAVFEKAVFEDGDVEQTRVPDGMTVLGLRGGAPDNEKGEVDMHAHVARARSIFQEICPDTPFLAAQQAETRPADVEEDDALTALTMQRIAIPQPVDLTYFRYLGGRV